MEVTTVTHEADCLVGIAECTVIVTVADILGTGATGLQAETIITLGADAHTLAVQAVGHITESVGHNWWQASN